MEEQTKDRRGRLSALDSFFAEAKAYSKAKEAGRENANVAPMHVPAWEAMLPWARGQLPLMIHADEVRQIQSALRWASTNGYKMILAGGRDAWMLADDLRERRVPVIYEAVFTLPPRDIDSYDVQFRAPAVLFHAGVRVCFGYGGRNEASTVRNLPYAAAQAVAFGLPREEAWKGLTLYPAEILGVTNRLGAILPGREATFFASDGDILDIRSAVNRVWIAGREVSLETRHTRLYEKYRRRPKPESP